MYDIGRVVIKKAGRDAEKTGVIIKKIDNNYVMIDGYTRRKKVNVNHLIPTEKIVKIKEDAKRDEILKELKKIDIKE